jgi:6-pyruvoyltetrahydropterin/6-carboxytetrahydropterin synthase
MNEENMEKIRVTKEFHFEMAHALWNYDGKCKHIHGHSYKLLVTLRGEPIQDPNDPKLGMILDFGDLKKIVKEPVVDMLDHSLALNKIAGPAIPDRSNQMYHKVHFFDFQPTVENLVLYIADTVKALLPPGIDLYSVRLHETASAYAEWYMIDNQ